MANKDMVGGIVDNWVEEEKPMVLEEMVTSDMRPVNDNPQESVGRSSGTLLSENYISILRENYPWVNRAFASPLVRTDSGKTMFTAVEYNPEHGWILFPLVRENTETGNLAELDLRKAQDIALSKGDYIKVPDMEFGNEISKGLSESIDREADKINKGIPVEDNNTGLLPPPEQPRESIPEQTRDRLYNEVQQVDFNEDIMQQRLRTDHQTVNQDVKKILDGISAIISTGDIGSSGGPKE
mgnify:CR=1 FL=1